MGLYFLVFIVSFEVIAAQNYYTFKKEGDRCVMPDNSTGICKRRISCERPSQLPILHNEYLGFQPCGFTEADEKLHCCLSSVTRALAACEQYKNDQTPSIFPFVSHGVLAEAGEFPHMVAFKYPDPQGNVKTPWRCGGSLISSRFVLTAAHCLVGSTIPTEMRVGAANLTAEKSSERDSTYGIEKIILHPLYKKVKSVYNDIALVRSASEVLFNEYVFPACLHTERSIFAKEFTTAGYGDTENKHVEQLYYTKMHEVDQKACDVAYQVLDEHTRKLKIPRGVITSVLCAASKPNGAGKFSDTCPGDSGGPLQYMKQNVFHLVGVISWGLSCGSQAPGFYTRVSDFAPWIETFVWRD